MEEILLIKDNERKKYRICGQKCFGEEEKRYRKMVVEEYKRTLSGRYEVYQSFAENGLEKDKIVNRWHDEMEIINFSNREHGPILEDIWTYKINN